MKTAIIENNKLKIIEKETIELTQKGAIVKVLGCGLCGSDIVKLKSSNNEGLVLGHEVVGIITQINSNVDFQVGDKIVLGHHVPCFECQYCWGESYSMCKTFKKTNIIPGGFSEFIFVSELHLNNTVFKVSSNLNDDEIAFLEPLACCIRAVKRARLHLNSSVLIIGLGSIGLLMGQCAKALGYKAYGCDLIPERVELAKKLGFEESFLFKNNENTSQLIKSKISEIGVDAVFMTAGADKTIDFALSAVRDGGTIVIFASIKSDLGYKNNDIYYRELKILGSYSPSPMDLENSLELLESRKINVNGLSSIYEFNEINKAIDDTISNKIIKAYIKL